MRHQPMVVQLQQMSPGVSDKWDASYVIKLRPLIRRVSPLAPSGHPVEICDNRHSHTHAGRRPEKYAKCPS